LEIIEEMRNDISIYRLQGQLDTNASREFEQKLFKAIRNGAKNLVLNFTGNQVPGTGSKGPESIPPEKNPHQTQACPGNAP
jgi:hypothetical protein